MKFYRMFILGVVLVLLPLTALWAKEKPEQQYEGWKGVWLKSAAAEVFVIAKPYPRVLVFRKIGEPSHLFTGPNEYIGVRTWFMESQQNDDSPLPARQPGEFKTVTPLKVVVEGATDPATRLRVGLEVSLDPEKPVMRVRHLLTNAGEKDRKVAVWSINALKRDGKIIVPWGEGEKPFRTVVYYPITSAKEPGLQLGLKALGLDLSLPVTTGQMKVGIRTESGWAAHVMGDSVLKVSAPFAVGGDYPEGGANLTVYQTGAAKNEGWSEIEHISQSETLKPGRTLSLEEKYSLLTVIPPGEDTPDAWLDALKKSAGADN
jgi:hypothetical protein